MIRARLSNGVFILGLDAENIMRMLDNKPILVSLSELGGTDDVLIMAGNTLDDVKRQLEEASGQPLPPAIDLDKARNTQ